MIERNHKELPIVKQCGLLSISRPSFYHEPKGDSTDNLKLMAEIDRQFLDTQFYGVQQMTWHLRAKGWMVNVKRVRISPIFRWPRAFSTLVAIMDWHSGKVLSWRLSNTTDVQFCADALEEALNQHGSPDIFNTDQGSLFTSWAWTYCLKEAGVRPPWAAWGRWYMGIACRRTWRHKMNQWSNRPEDPDCSLNSQRICPMNGE